MKSKYLLLGGALVLYYLYSKKSIASQIVNVPQNTNNNSDPNNTPGEPITLVSTAVIDNTPQNYHLNFPNQAPAGIGAGGYPVSRYKIPVNGALYPTLTDWITAMRTKEGFNTWIKNVKEFNKNPMFMTGATNSTGKWYIIDGTHYIRVAFDDHGWTFQFMLITQPYKNDGVLNLPRVLPAVLNTQPPDPTTWWGSYDGGNADAPKTVAGTSFF